MLLEHQVLSSLLAGDEENEKHCASKTSGDPPDHRWLAHSGTEPALTPNLRDLWNLSLSEVCRTKTAERNSKLVNY